MGYKLGFNEVSNAYFGLKMVIKQGKTMEKQVLGKEVLPRQCPRRVVLQNLFLLNWIIIIVINATVFFHRFSNPFFLEGLLHYITQFRWSCPQFIDRSDHYLSVCPIRHFPKSLVSCGSQDGTVQGSSSHKCNKEVW